MSTTRIEICAVAALGSLLLLWCGACFAQTPATLPAGSSHWPSSSSLAGRARFEPLRRLPPVESTWGPTPVATFHTAHEPTHEPLHRLISQSDHLRALPDDSYTFDFSSAGPTDMRGPFGPMRRKIGQDYCNYYSRRTLWDVSLAVALAAPLANTSLDGDFDTWYQRDVRSSGTDGLAGFWKTFGEGQLFIPAFAGLWLIGEMLEDSPAMDTIGAFGGRTTRAYAVGAPPVLLMQFGLGGGRPGEHASGSQWRPFQDNNAVSGHAFVGAVPFITAAKMTDDPWAKGALYACSTLTAWSRVNDHDHYLTQACLGWWMAYVACRAVDEIDRRDRGFEVVPLVTPEMSGLGVMYRR